MAEKTTENILGREILIPFRREGGDLAYGEGKDAIRSSIRQILMTKKGELRWNPDFGLNTERLRHKGITEAMLGEIQADVASTLMKYEPRIEIVDIIVGQEKPKSNKVIVRVKWRAIDRGRQRNTVLTDVEDTEVII